MIKNMKIQRSRSIRVILSSDIIWHDSSDIILCTLVIRTACSWALLNYVYMWYDVNMQYQMHDVIYSDVKLMTSVNIGSDNGLARSMCYQWMERRYIAFFLPITVSSSSYRQVS